MGGPSAKGGLAAKLCVLIFKASLLDYLGGPSAKVCSSAKFCVVVFKACILNSEGVNLAKLVFSAKCCVLVFKISMVCLWEVHLPKYVCLPSVVYWYSRYLCSIHVGVLSAKVDLCTQNGNQNVPQWL